ncbi:MAG: saccharopine dehydrogenase NADP-binding domain-containing protein [Alphaproteobacteria bacterium]|nr:saccharopine dehydrogenase NADP-binding domain-containing protein [Alphaproteobacteria bacterium]
MNGPVVVVGATGHTGGLVARALAARGTPTRLAGRRPEALAPLADALGPAVVDVVRVEVDDVRSLHAAFEGAGAVVNTVGPFLRLGLPIAAAAVDRGVPYVDCTAEQAFVRRVWEALDLPAQRTGVSVLPGHGADWGLACLAVGVLSGAVGHLRRVDSYHDLGGFTPSAGTARSMLEMVGEPVVGFADGAWGDLDPRVRRVSLPTGTGILAVPFAGGDVALLPRDLPSLRHVGSHLVLSGAEAWGVSLGQRLLSAARPLLRPTWLHPVADAVAARLPEPAQPAPWSLWTRADGDATAWMLLEGDDTYAVSAELLAEIGTRLARGEAMATGVRSAAVALPAAEVLDGLAGVRARVVPEWRVGRATVSRDPCASPGAAGSGTP